MSEAFDNIERLFDTFQEQATIDEIETQVIRWETFIAHARAKQTELLRTLDAAQVAAGDGARNLTDWTAARLDVRHDTAAELVHAARTLPEHPTISDALTAGRMTLDRASATMRLITAGASPHVVDHSFGLDLAGVQRLTARHRRISRTDERRTFADRFWASQHSFNQGRARFWGELPGFEMELVEKALQERADGLPATPDDCSDRRPQRMVDALVAMSLDTIDPIASESPPADGMPDGTAYGEDFADGAPGRSQRRPLVTVFVDAGLASGTGGEAGAEMVFGPRVGPDLLDEILCGGAVQVVGVEDGRPITVTDETQAIPPAIRRFIEWRDSGCAIDGCRSRYRLQPHHVRHRRHGGDNDPDNLEMLCWFHHHVMIHRHGFRLDPHSPPRRRRFLRNHKHGPAPP